MKPSASRPGDALVPSDQGAEQAADPTILAQATARRAFIEQSAVALGQTWAERWRQDLQREGRPAAGGWPGTLREARIYVERALFLEMKRRKMAAITGEEREIAARAAYASARNDWRRNIEPETP